MGLALDELKDDDTEITSNGIDIIINKRDKGYVRDSIIDYIDSYWGGGLVIRPVYGGSCG